MRAFVAAAAIAAVLLQVASAGTLPRPGANATAPLQTCGGNCPSGDCPGAYAALVLSGGTGNVPLWSACTRILPGNALLTRDTRILRTFTRWS